MTIIFNFFGGPGTGKSTCATYSFAMSKDDRYNAEYVPEKAKDWAWERRNITLIDQFGVLQNQCTRESRLFGEASVVFTDSPVWLCAYYASISNPDFVRLTVEQLCRDHYDVAVSRGVKHHNIWLTRCKPYNAKGRFQTEDEAKAIDADMRRYFESLGVSMIECPGKKEDVYEMVKSILKNSYA